MTDLTRNILITNRIDVEGQKQYLNKIIIVLCLLFAICPVATTIVYMAFRMMNPYKQNKLDFLTFVFIATCACLLQSTRIWDVQQPSDWYNDGYWGLFKEVKNKSLVTYLAAGVKEPGWRIINYIGYYIFGDSYFHFANTLAMLSLFITSYAIYNYWRYLNKSSIILVCMLSLFVFFTEYWSQLNTMLRQMFAMSLITYAMVYRVIHQKHIWWLMILACLIHTFAFIYLFLMVLPILYKKITKKGFFILGIGGSILFFLLKYVSFFSVIFSDISFVSYGFNRLATAADALDQNFLDSTAVFLTSCFIISICIYKNYYLVPDKKNIFFTNLLMIIMFVCILLTNFMPEIMGRIYVSRFYLFPFVLPFLKVKSKALTYIYLISVILFFSIRFFLNFDTIRGGGFFPPITDIATYNIIDFIL